MYISHLLRWLHDGLLESSARWHSVILPEKKGGGVEDFGSRDIGGGWP